MDNKMLGVRLDKDTEFRLEALCKKTGRTKSYYAKKAIIEFIENREDYLLAIARLEENNLRIPYDQIRKELGLDD